MGRKACRREVEAMLEKVGLRPPPSILGQDDVTRAFLAARCLACERCPGLCRRFTRWRMNAPSPMAMPPRLRPLDPDA